MSIKEIKLRGDHRAGYERNGGSHSGRCGGAASSQDADAREYCVQHRTSHYLTCTTLARRGSLQARLRVKRNGGEQRMNRIIHN